MGSVLTLLVPMTAVFCVVLDTNVWPVPPLDLAGGRMIQIGTRGLGLSSSTLGGADVTGNGVVVAWTGEL